MKKQNDNRTIDEIAIETTETNETAETTETTESLAIREANSFKTPYVREAVARIYSLRAGLETRIDDFKKAEDNARREVAKLLYQISKEKLYKTEGFKSLAAFAETIGISKSEAHKLENAGRLLNSSNDAIREYAEQTSLTNLRELASAEPAKVTEAIQSGALRPEDTVEAVKRWKATTTAAKPKVVDRMNYAGAEYYNTTLTALDGASHNNFFIENALPDELPFLNDYQWSFTKVGEERVHIGFNPKALDSGYEGPVMAWYVAHKPVKVVADLNKAAADKDAEIAELKAKLEALMAQMAGK